MKRGTHTVIDHLAHRLMQRWVPKWYGAFVDQENGGFYERLDSAFQPIQMGQRRLITQCRQLAIYSDASLQQMGRGFKPDLEKCFSFMVQTYHTCDGRWRFSVDDNGVPLDNTYDLYAHAFVIFALAHYYRATQDKAAKELAGQTLEFINNSFRVEDMPGLAEALDEELLPIAKVRRHESHMHLLEACLFAAGTWESDTAYMNMADEMIGLFSKYFYDADQLVLSEYYNDDLSVPSDGTQIIVEPGHYYEWIWLLKKHANICGDDAKYDHLCRPLLAWANEHGWDKEYGGIYDELSPDGSVIEDTKRLWPFSEAIKANALMLDSEGIDKQELKNRIADMVEVFETYYMKERGFWLEWLNRDMSSSTDYMPGTTPYHVYFGIMEARETLYRRGRTKSVLASTQIALYTLRRSASAAVRNIRKSIKRV